MNKNNSKSTGGHARAKALTPERRQEIALSAVAAKKERSLLPKATHGSAERPIKIGEIEIPCYVLSDGRRVLTMRGLQTSLGFSSGGGKDGARKLPSFLSRFQEKGLLINDLVSRADSPIEFTSKGSSKVATGYEATILVEICEAVLSAKDAGLIDPASPYVRQSEMLVRGLARVGIIALVDEATGYQQERDRDSLARILEAWVAQELQPYVSTFPPSFYEELFRLRGLQYPPENPKFRPQYFGLLTNDIVYERLAPGLLDELKKHAAKDEKKAHLHRRLTQEVGHPKLREHLSSVVTAMKLSNNYGDFISNLNRIHPRLGQRYTKDLEKLDV